VNITKRLLPDGLNHTKGRPMDVDQITIHVTEGSAASVRSWFAAKEAQVSAHYMVCVDGTIDQFVDEADQAWHNGRVDHPTAPLVLARPHVNPNAFSIGIEHEGDGTRPLTAPQRAASVELLRDISRRRPLVKLDRTHIVGHHEVYSKKTCPGAIDVNALVILAKNNAPLDRPAPPLVVWSGYLGDWLVVTKVVTDTEWWFVSLKDAQRGPATRSTNSLAAMPRALS
jgi:N-acetylmuramoyl-L-alanine amidase